LVHLTSSFGVTRARQHFVTWLTFLKQFGMGSGVHH